MDRPLIFHVALADDWNEALRSGRYPWSTRGLTVSVVGYTHCSFEHQWLAVRNRYYSDLKDTSLVLLVIDESRLTSPLVIEQLDAPEAYPHIYGEIDIASVVDVRSIAQ